MAIETIEQIICEIDAITPRELAVGLRVAVKAFRIKADRVHGLDRAWMRGQATRFAAALLDIATGGVPL